jgi:hypothetical protein
MAMNLVRISKVDEIPGFPIKKSTLYKWHHLQKYPELFVQIGGAVFVNMDKFEEMIANGGTRRRRVQRRERNGCKGVERRTAMVAQRG